VRDERSPLLVVFGDRRLAGQRCERVDEDDVLGCRDAVALVRIEWLTAHRNAGEFVLVRPDDAPAADVELDPAPVAVVGVGGLLEDRANVRPVEFTLDDRPGERTDRDDVADRHRARQRIAGADGPAGEQAQVGGRRVGRRTVAVLAAVWRDGVERPGRRSHRVGGEVADATLPAEALAFGSGERVLDARDDLVDAQFAAALAVGLCQGSGASGVVSGAVERPGVDLVDRDGRFLAEAHLGEFGPAGAGPDEQCPVEAVGTLAVEVPAEDDVGVDIPGDPRVLGTAVGEHHAIVDIEVGEGRIRGGDRVTELQTGDRAADVGGVGVGDADDPDPAAAAFDDGGGGHVLERVGCLGGRDVRTAVRRGDGVGPLGGPFGTEIEVVVAERLGGGRDRLEEGTGLRPALVGEKREHAQRGGVAGADDERAVVAAAFDGGRERADPVGVVVEALQVRVPEQVDHGLSVGRDCSVVVHCVGVAPAFGHNGVTSEWVRPGDKSSVSFRAGVTLIGWGEQEGGMATSGDRSTPHVLYVDPDEDRASEGVRVLEQHSMTVELVADAAAARRRVEEDSPDCVVLEEDLGEASGLGLVRGLTDDDPHPPVVMFTDDGDEFLASDAISAGVADYVPREPVGKQRLALADAVERVLSETDPAFPEVSEQLKDQAMDEAPVGITIADARRIDYPLIYANAAFEKLTGYTEAEALARNCDFLQSDESDPNAIAEMSRALSRDEPVSVEIQNYTRDGERFWNRVDIAPIFGADGDVTHYVGFQLDVTERVEAEQEARRQAEKARDERETVEALLARVDGLVTDVTSGLLSAEDRAEVERAVCERFVATDEYALAWVGDPAPASNTVEPSTWVGSDRPDGFSVALDGEDPVARAIATGELQVVADEDETGTLDAYAEYVGEPVSAVAALPLQYGDVNYGVLVVALGADATLSEPERRVLSAVGQSTAMALHDLTSQRLLTSDEVIELEFVLDSGGGEDTAPFFVDLSRRLDATFAHVGTVARDDGPTTLFFETDADPDTVESALADGSEAVSVTTVTSETGRSVLEFIVESSPLVDLLLDRGGRITDMRATGGLGEVTVEIPPEAQPRAVVEAVEERFSGADLRAYREHERPADTRQDVRARIDDRLTDRQETALQTAIVGGFFEWPRDSTGEDLAETMDIGRSTFHQHLRAAQRKVFEELYG